MTASRKAELESIVGAGVSRETYERLHAFEAEFGRWARRINLVAPSTLSDLWRRHILDSAQLLPLAPDARAWLDLGSGGGFPGAVLAILLTDRPGSTIRLVESNGKKAAFLRTVLGSLGVPVQIEVARIEACRARAERVDVVTARALADLARLLGLAEPWLSAGAAGLFHKGRDYRREIEESRDAWQFDLVEHRSVVDPESVIITIRDLRRKT